MSEISQLAKKIKEIRNRHNMSQERFGRKIGVSGKTVSAYETGKCAPPIRILQAISKTFDFTILHMRNGKKDEMYEKLKSVKDSISALEDILDRSLSI